MPHCINLDKPYEGLRSPLEMLYHWEKNSPDAVCIRQPIDGVWTEFTWRQAALEVRKMAAHLTSLGYPKGSRIAIFSKNCSYWLLADLAIMMAGHVSVPLYPNLTERTIRQILEHSEASLCFVGKLDAFETMRGGIPNGVKLITFPIYSQPNIDKWDDLVRNIEPLADTHRALEELMTIIYTSGTTGEPKGVMHRFQNFSFAVSNAILSFKGLDQSSVFFSYLPLSHIAERIVVEAAWLYTGGTSAFAESLDLFAKNLQETQPTIFLGVPRIWVKFQMAILSKISQKRLNFLLSIPFVNDFIRKKIKKTLGLSRAKYALTGAAPIAISTLEWYRKLGINIQEGYAMTENSAYSHFTRSENPKFGTVGQALPGNQVRISADNEIQCKCPSIMVGYYKDEKQTAETLTADGWLRTGDTGTIDDDGYLRITGRVKEIFKTTKGKYVAPAPLEMRLQENTYIEQICVTGANVPQPIALVCLSAQAKELPREILADSIANTLRSLNEQIDSYEKIACVVIMNEDWTVENNFLTPTLKIKRNFVEDAYKKNYESWYAQNREVVFA